MWVKQYETDTGHRDGVTSVERDRIEELERENRQLRQANEILKKASAFHPLLEPVARRVQPCAGGACLMRILAPDAKRSRCPAPQMIAFIKDHRSIHGVEPICRVPQIAPSTFYERLAVERDSGRSSDRAKRDAYLCKEMKAVWERNRSVYGARKLWHAMRREKIDIACFTVERLMRQLGFQGVRRG